MSTETAPDPTTVEQNGHVATSPGMGGSSTDENGRADGQEQTVEGQEQEPEGASPEGAERTGEEPAQREETQDGDPAYVEMQQQLAEADVIARTIMADPSRLREFRKWQAADNGGGGDDRLAGIDRDIEQRFPRQEDRDAVRSFVGPMAQELRDLREQLRTLAPQVEQSVRVATSTAIQNSLEQHGVSAETQRTPEFKKFLARERRDADLQRDMTRRPGYAGKNLARAWAAQSGVRSQRSAENQRTETLKNGRLHAAPNTSRNGVTKAYVVDKSEPGWDVKMLHARIAAESRGEKFVPTYAKPK